MYSNADSNQHTISRPDATTFNVHEFNPATFNVI